MALQNGIMVTSTQFGTLISQAPVPVLVLFGAEWANRCRLMETIVDGIAACFPAEVLVLGIDLERSPELFLRYDVRYVPTCAVFRGGKLVRALEDVTPGEDLLDLLGLCGAAAHGRPACSAASDPSPL